MTNEMIALEKTYPREGLWQVTAPVPEIGPDDVLIRINKTGICGTDIHIWNWDNWAAKTVPTPLITGHEFAGEIVEILPCQQHAGRARHRDDVQRVVRRSPSR